MMYHTPNGDRTFQGAFGDLLRSAIFEVGHRISLEIPRFLADAEEIGVEAFDNLSPGQRAWLLVNVGESLLCRKVPPLQLTAPVEATVAAMFQVLADDVVFEIEEHRRQGQAVWLTTRRMIRLAMKAEKLDAPDFPLPKVTMTAVNEWELCLEMLSMAILYDCDWEMESECIDLPAEYAALWRQDMHIDDEYYAAIVPDPRDSEIPELAKRWTALWRWKRRQRGNRRTR